MRPGTPALRPWRIATLVALASGAVASGVLTWRAGAQSPVRLLVWMFVLWVLSPFVGLAVATIASKHWLPNVRRRVHTVAWLVTIVSVIAYGVRVSAPPRTQGAFTFLVVPGLAWLVILVVVGMAGIVARRERS